MCEQSVPLSLFIGHRRHTIIIIIQASQVIIDVKVQRSSSLTIKLQDAMLRYALMSPKHTWLLLYVFCNTLRALFQLKDCILNLRSGDEEFHAVFTYVMLTYVG